MNQEIQNSLMYWENYYRNNNQEAIIYDNWLDVYIEKINKTQNPILDLGCGSGNDTLYLIKYGKQVIPCDQSPNAINGIIEKFPEVTEAHCFNMLDGLPFKSESFDVIVADLCLHYFLKEDTKRIVSEIERVLRPCGCLLFRVNSIHDINHGAGQGQEMEPHLYLTSDGRYKRFFDEKDIRYFFGNFEIEDICEETMVRYRLEKKLYKGCARKANIS